MSILQLDYGSGAAVEQKPNIVYILADDLGYGDVACLNPLRGRIPTPHLDGLAKEGMVFTDAHASSSVCTPSRYGILTGRYNWRSRLQHGIVLPYEEPLLAPDRLTVAGLLSQHGYHTACIGKWHLGWNWPITDAQRFAAHALARFDQSPAAYATDAHQAAWRDIFSQPIAGGPTARGFQYYFGVDVPNWPPYCWIENDRSIGIPSELLPAELLEGFQASLQGPAMATWNLLDLLPTLIDRSCRYITQQASAREPFFLYLALTSPHTPLAVHDEWRGKSGLNLYADFVMETDAMIGQVLRALETASVADNTLVIVASDNGCARYIGVSELESKGHYPSAQFRGYKSDIWDGGHRIPFITRWPKVIRSESTCEQLVCLTDLMATCAEIQGVTRPVNAAEDSVSLLPLLRGSQAPVRDHVVSHSLDGKFAIRDQNWKLVLCAGSGGWSKKDADAGREGLPPVQLYDLASDPGETTNVCIQNQQRIRKMVDMLNEIVASGRSTSCVTFGNDVAVDIWKLENESGTAARIRDDYDPQLARDS